MGMIALLAPSNNANLLGLARGRVAAKGVRVVLSSRALDGAGYRP